VKAPVRTRALLQLFVDARADSQKGMLETVKIFLGFFNFVLLFSNTADESGYLLRRYLSWRFWDATYLFFNFLYNTFSTDWPIPTF
jgi:hypothetical protein